MNGIILCAGRGTRLLPLTEKLPKSMLSVKGKPILEYLIELFAENGIKKIVLNLNYLPKTIKDYFGRGEKWGVKIDYLIENRLSGSAVGAKKSFALLPRSPVIISYGDNITNLNLKDLIDFHRKKDGMMTMVVHKKDNPYQSGNVGFKRNKRLTRFAEKPAVVFSHWVNAGIYRVKPEIFDYVFDDEFCDFSCHLFPRLLQLEKKLFVYPISSDVYYDSMDDIKSYQRICQK